MLLTIRLNGGDHGNLGAMHHFRVRGSDDTLDAEAGWNIIFGGNRVGPGAFVGGPTESESEGLSKSGQTL
jgi:hypothetical protein